MKGFDVLDPNLDLHQNHFLEASAGTGKTFAIENIVSRLIESGMDLERILIVTFTRAATSDLKMRIRRNIATKGLQEALFKFDQAKIFTIHSFCYHALREHALEADLSLEIEEEPATDIERELIKDYLRSLSTFSPFQLEKLLRKGIDHLVDQILRIAADRIPVHTGRSYDEIIQELRSLSCDHEQLFQHAHYYGKMCNKQKELKQDRIDALNDFVRFMQGEDVNIVDNPILLMNEQNRLKRAPEAYFPFLERAIPLVEELSDELGILAHLCQGASKKLEESDQMQFEDLLIKMDQKVDEPLFASKIAKQYDCVLIDEFQDTNPLQWRIFKKLFLNKLLYLVGDPKQAIYRFRHADIYTYMEARRCFEKCEVLNTNYRSTKSVVTKLNELFANFQFELPKTGETIAYQSVEYDASKEDEGGVFHLKAQKEEQLFAAICNRVKEPFSSNAVLVKDRYQAERFLNFAKEQGYPAVSQRARSLLESPAFSALKQLLTATLHPYDRQARMTTLGGPLFFLSFDQLDQHNPFLAYNAILNEKGLFSFFTEWTKEWGANLVAADEQLYQDLLQLVEFLAEMQIAPIELVPYMERMKDELPARQNSDADAIVVLTTHVSKGLEFDTVFPIGLIKSSPRRRELACIDGAYRATTAHHSELDAEEMRQLYVAFTRAKKQLYIMSLADGKGVINRFLEGVDFPGELVEEDVRRLLPKRGQEISKPLVIQRKDPMLQIDSFSSLFEHVPSGVKSEEGKLPGGAEVGVHLHTIFERLDFANFEQELPPLIQNSPLAEHYDEVYEMVHRALTEELPGVGPLYKVERMIKEMEFLYKTERGYMKGFIDLFFEVNGKWYIADWKSNLIDDLEVLMERNHYDEQAKIYKEAAVRYLEHVEGEFAGCFYIFLRKGGGVVVRNESEL